MQIVSDEIFRLVESQTSSFKDYTAQHVLDSYQIGKSDIVLHFSKGTMSIASDPSQLFQNKHIVNVRTKQVGNLFARALSKHPDLVNVDLFVPICLSDATEPQMQNIPALVFCKKTYSNHILIPTINNFEGHWEVEQVNMADSPLHTKENKICFVGSLTGRMDDVKNNQRVIIANNASVRKDRYHCKLLRPPLYDPDEFQECIDRCKKEYPAISDDVLINSDSRVDLPSQLKYKFQLCVDGHVSAWARLPWQMASNSIPFKLRNRKDSWVEWFYPLLDFSKHCIELDLEDIDEAYEYFVNNPQYQDDVNQAGKDFVKKYCGPELAMDVFAQTLLLLNQKQDNTYMNRMKQ